MNEINQTRAFAYGFGTDYYEVKQDGMYLRDYFAAKAMQGICSCLFDTPELNYNLIAEDAYKIADAMLKTRGI